MSFPSFATGEVLTAADMNAVGLWLVKTQTFSSATNCDVTACFSADYENYVAVISLTASLTGQYTNVQLLNGTTPKTVNYNRTNFVATSGAVLAVDSNNIAASAWRLCGQSATRQFTTATFYRPFSTATTGYYNHSVYTGPSNFQLYTAGGEQTENYSATGFRILADGNAATYSGTVRVYGYKD